MMFSRYIPNIFTMGNLLCGVVGTYFAAFNRLDYAAYMVILGIFLDFFDGFFARMLNVQSELGLQLDSLADVVTSGVVPGMVMFQLLRKIDAWGGAFIREGDLGFSDLELMPFVGFAITLASAYRLAKFNIDDRQSEGFIGLPTPANALLIVSIPLIIQFQDVTAFETLINNEWVLLGLIIVSCFLLNAELPLFALKFKSWSFGLNKVRYLFLILCLILLVWLKFLAVPVIILSYILISLITYKRSIS